MTEWKPYSFNIVRHRGDPKEAVLLSGHRVTKQESVFFQDGDGGWHSAKCADYHTEHFVYLNPLYMDDGPKGRGQWFAMCTCGSPAVIIDPLTAAGHETDAKMSLLVCYLYQTTLSQYGVGQHTTGGRQN
jgi:hypothetical protein